MQQQQPSTFTVPAQRAAWAKRALQQANIRAQAQQQGKNFTFTVSAKDADKAEQALEPVTNYQSGGGWRTTIRHTEDAILMWAWPVAGIALFVAGGGVFVLGIGIAGGIIVWLWNRSHESLHRQHNVNQAAGLSGVGCAGNMWTWLSVIFALAFAGAAVALALGLQP